ncbi:MAG TPA: GDP-L-fucose synthase [Longimicrobiales bacterium]
MNAADKIYVAGHTGLVGSAIVRRLQADGFDNLLLRRHSDLDLEDQAAVNAFFERERPAYVIVAAAKVGGIVANNTYPADFIAINLAIALNVISAAHHSGTRKLLFLSSSCVYPKLAPQPLREEYLLSGPLEPTNDAYAIAKIAGMKLAEAYHRQHGDQFFSVLPTNVYGPFDNFDLQTSHVLPALIRKFHEAQESGAGSIELWGTGTPRREFIHADDLADACVFLMRNYSDSAPVNIGVGTDSTIAELAQMIARIVGFRGQIKFDHSHPDGTPRKLLDTSRLTDMGWQSRVGLEEGIAKVYDWYRAHVAVAV